MSDTIEGCYTCRFYIPGARSATKDGTCHRLAPAQWQDETPPPEPDEPDENGSMMLTMVTVQMYTGWPDVRQSDWCGEHETRR